MLEKKSQVLAAYPMPTRYQYTRRITQRNTENLCVPGSVLRARSLVHIRSELRAKVP